MFVSISQVIGCEDRLRNDLYSVEWGVKLYSNQRTLNIPPHLAYVATLPCETLMSAKQAIKDKLQGSVTAYLSCGAVVNKQIKKGLLLSRGVEIFFKSVNIWQSYKQERDYLMSAWLCVWLAGVQELEVRDYVIWRCRRLLLLLVTIQHHRYWCRDSRHTDPPSCSPSAPPPPPDAGPHVAPPDTPTTSSSRRRRDFPASWTAMATVVHSNRRQA